MRNDYEYIVNLTKQLIPARLLSAMDVVGRGQDHRHAWFLFLYAMLKEKVSRMNDETLGRICGCGHTRDFSEPLETSSGFIFKTGIEDVTAAPYDPKLSGRKLLEEIAIRTIVAVACDIVLQPNYEEARRESQDLEDTYDRGMCEYVHRGSNARQL